MPPRRHITPRMLAANRANAQRSTGPRTAAGKAASRRNGLVHGLRATTLAAPLLESDEDRAEYEALLAALRDEFRPATPLEELLVRNLVLSRFVLRRALLAEAAAMAQAAHDDGPGADPPSLPVATMDAILRFEVPWQRRFSQSLAALLELQALRRRLQALAARLPAPARPSPRAAACARPGRVHHRRRVPAFAGGCRHPAHRLPLAPPRLGGRFAAGPLSRSVMAFVYTKNRRANPIFTHLYAPRPPPAGCAAGHTGPSR